MYTSGRSRFGARSTVFFTNPSFPSYVAHDFFRHRTEFLVGQNTAHDTAQDTGRKRMQPELGDAYERVLVEGVLAAALDVAGAAAKHHQEVRQRPAQHVDDLRHHDELVHRRAAVGAPELVDAVVGGGEGGVEGGEHRGVGLGLQLVGVACTTAGNFNPSRPSR